jgi:hypothetical protein
MPVVKLFTKSDDNFLTNINILQRNTKKGFIIMKTFKQSSGTNKCWLLCHLTSITHIFLFFSVEGKYTFESQDNFAEFLNAVGE